MADDDANALTGDDAVTDEMTLNQAERVCAALVNHLIEEVGCNGVHLILLGEFLAGLAEGSSDATHLAGTLGPIGAELDRLRPLLHARGYEKQFAFSNRENGVKVGGA